MLFGLVTCYMYSMAVLTVACWYSMAVLTVAVGTVWLYLQ
jgi:hypothetical protein